MTPTQADREAEEAIYRDWERGIGKTGEIAMRHRLAAEAAAFEKAAGVAKEHQAARLAAKHNALERGQKAEARDHESMAMEAGYILVSLQTFIRKLAGEKHD